MYKFKTFLGTRQSKDEKRVCSNRLYLANSYVLQNVVEQQQLNFARTRNVKEMWDTFCMPSFPSQVRNLLAVTSSGSLLCSEIVFNFA